MLGHNIYRRAARRRDWHARFSGSSTDPEEILRRLKELRESGRSLAVSNAQGDSTSPWLHTGVRKLSDRPGEHSRGSHSTLPMLGLWRNSLSTSLFPTPPAPASSDLSVLARKGEQRQDRQEPLTGVYWLKAVEQLRPQSPRMNAVLRPQSPRMNAVEQLRPQMEQLRPQSPRMPFMLSPRIPALQVQHLPAAIHV